jgi:hypothetical protein
MRKSEQESPLARRLRELEEEERALQQHVKEVSRKARKMESLNSEPGFSRTEPRVASTVPRPGAPPPPVIEEVVEQAAPPPRPAPAPGMAPRNPNPRETDRFANYFASGSFGKSRPMVRERRVMRNKAIFMLILVALVGFLVYRLAFGS